VINERVVVGYGKTMPAKTPLSETISNAVRKGTFSLDAERIPHYGGVVLKIKDGKWVQP
jgi:vacuolar-type H+-ATPase subunit E/Vma4